RHRREPLSPRVLEQVAGKLAYPGLLILGESGPIARRKEHAVLVGHIRSRDREGLVFLHLPRQLAGDLDRPHLRAEGSAEGAFDEVGDLALEVAQETHGRERPIPRRDGDATGVLPPNSRNGFYATRPAPTARARSPR